MDNTTIKNLITYIILASIFITGAGFGGDTFVIYWYYPIYALFIIYGILVYHRINLSILAVFIGITLYAVVTYKAGFSLVVKQLVNLTFYGLTFYFLLCHEHFDIVGVFRKYIKFSKWILVIGFVQVFLYALDLGAIYSFVFPFLDATHTEIRLQSIAQEPSLIAFTFSPIVFLSLHNVFYKTDYLLSKRWSWLFIIGYLLTQTTNAYLAFIIMLILLYFKSFTVRKLQFALIFFGAICLVGFIFYKVSAFIKVRVDDTIYGFTTDFGQGDTYAKLHLTSYAVVSNYYVTKKSLQNHPWTGNGLGTHELVYEKYIPYQVRSYAFFGMNRLDATGLGLRILSEMGIIFFLAFCFFVIKFRLKSRSYFSDTQEILWIINTGMLLVIILALLRNGNYTLHGKILFFYLYYFSWRHLKDKITFAPKSDHQNLSLQT
jgi:hypothetical protein